MTKSELKELINEMVKEEIELQEGLFGNKKEKVDPETIMNKAIQTARTLWNTDFSKKAKKISLSVDTSSCTKYVLMPKLVFAREDEIHGNLIPDSDKSLINKYKSDLQNILRVDDATSKCTVSQLNAGTLVIGVK